MFQMVGQCVRDVSDAPTYELNVIASLWSVRPFLDSRWPYAGRAVFASILACSPIAQAQVITECGLRLSHHPECLTILAD